MPRVLRGNGRKQLVTIQQKETNQWDSQFDLYFRVGVLYLERAHMHKLGLVAKKHRFAGSPFEAPALHFFGPPEDMSMEEHLVLCFEDVKTQKNFYACLVTTGIFHKKGETYRGQQKNDFKELLGAGFDLKARTFDVGTAFMFSDSTLL